MQQDFDSRGNVIRAQCGHADAEIHDETVLQLSRNPTGDDFSFRQFAHDSFILGLTVRFSMRFSYPLAWKIRWTKIAGVCTASGSSWPTSTSSSTSAIVMRRAVAITGLKFLAVF